MSAALPAWHKSLRRGRYEVTPFGPKNPITTARRPTAPMERYATEAAARQRALELLTTTPGTDLVEVVRVAPASARYPEGPWHTRKVATYRPEEVAQ